MTWNYPDETRCERCGSYYPEEESGRPKPPPPQHSDDDEDYDEFGRIRKPKDPDDIKPKWPPCFESEGSAFSLDARSGMFYEAESDFFYDPKSKLYYGNKKGAYYRYNEDTAKFEQVQKIDPVQAEDLESTNVATTKPSNKMKGISINLKTKSLPSGKPKKPKSVDKSSAPATKQQKQHAVDMEKWSDRQVEKRTTDRKIHRTAKGEPSKTWFVY